MDVGGAGPVGFENLGRGLPCPVSFDDDDDDDDGEAPILEANKLVPLISQNNPSLLIENIIHNLQET